MEEKKIHPFLQSSANPEKYSATIKGIAIGIIPAVIAFGPIFGIDITAIEMNDVVDKIIVAVQAIMTAVSAVVVAYGVLRKVIIRVYGNDND